MHLCVNKQRWAPAGERPHRLRKRFAVFRRRPRRVRSAAEAEDLAALIAAW
jgi:hypothetical protein